MEALLRIKGKSAQNQDKVTSQTSHFKPKRTGVKERYQVNVRQFTALQNVTYGSTHSIKLPSHGAMIGEVWLEIPMPALDNAGTYCPQLGASLIKRMKNFIGILKK